MNNKIQGRDNKRSRKCKVIIIKHNYNLKLKKTKNPEQFLQKVNPNFNRKIN